MTNSPHRIDRTSPATTPPGPGTTTSPKALFEKLLSVDEFLEVAVQGKVSRKTFYRWRKRGMPGAHLIGGAYWIEPSKALPWVEREVRR